MSGTLNKLAVLVPTYNGGDHLGRTIASCANAGLPGDRYEIIVIDNASTDGSLDKLAFRDSRGAKIQIHANGQNLGRVGNWNRAVEIAEQQGFRYCTFLFVGDVWLRNAALREHLDLLQETGAGIGFSPFLIGGEDGAVKRTSQRFYVSGNGAAVTSSQQFIAKLMESGLFPLGPLQCNIYSLSHKAALRFDPELPTRTDVEATLHFVRSSSRPVVIGSEPFFQWCEYSGRFHMSMGPRQTIRDYFETFHDACQHTRVNVDLRLAKSRVFLNAARLAYSDAPATEWPSLMGDIARHASISPHRVTLGSLAAALWSRFGKGRRLLEFGAGQPQSEPCGEPCVTQ